MHTPVSEMGIRCYSIALDMGWGYYFFGGLFRPFGRCFRVAHGGSGCCVCEVWTGSPRIVEEDCSAMSKVLAVVSSST